MVANFRHQHRGIALVLLGCRVWCILRVWIIVSRARAELDFSPHLLSFHLTRGQAVGLAGTPPQHVVPGEQAWLSQDATQNRNCFFETDATEGYLYLQMYSRYWYEISVMSLYIIIIVYLLFAVINRRGSYQPICYYKCYVYNYRSLSPTQQNEEES